jgi:hypothetical protein
MSSSSSKTSSHVVVVASHSKTTTANNDEQEEDLASTASSFLSRLSGNYRCQPPATVILHPKVAAAAVTPYAQLCYNQEFDTLSAMLVGSRSRRNKAKQHSYRRLLHVPSSSGGGGGRMGMGGRSAPPRLTFSSDNSSSDDDSDAGWSTGDDSSADSYEDDAQHRTHGVVWISREWYKRTSDPHKEAHNSDGRALLQELRLATNSNSNSNSNSNNNHGSNHGSSGDESSTTLLFLNCGRLLFCPLPLRKAEAPSSSSARHPYHPWNAASSHVHRHGREGNHPHKQSPPKQEHHKPRFYGYQLLDNY